MKIITEKGLKATALPRLMESVLEILGIEGDESFTLGNITLNFNVYEGKEKVKFYYEDGLERKILRLYMKNPE